MIAAARRAVDRWGPVYGAFAALFALVAANAVITPNFATGSSALNILIQVSTTVLVAVGMTLVIAAGGIDLSVGSVMAIASAVAVKTLDAGAAVAVAAALGAAALCGGLNGLLIARYQVQPIVVTLALLIGGRGVAQVIADDGQLLSFSHAGLESVGRGYLAGVPNQVLLTAAVVAAAALLLRAATFGRYLLAVGGNESAARLAGVPVRATKAAAYALSGALAGLAGVIETARLGACDGAKIGLNMELDAIAAVVVGGTALSGGRATIAGSVAGALLMQVITTTFNMRLIPYSWSLVLKAAIILAAVYVQRPKEA